MQTTVAHPRSSYCHPRAPPAVMPGLHKCDALRLRYTKTSFCISFASFASDRAPPIPTIVILAPSLSSSPIRPCSGQAPAGISLHL